MRTRHLLSLLGYSLPLMGLAFVIFLQNQHLDRLKASQKADYYREEQSVKFNLEIEKKMPSFGFQNLIADWIFLRYIQYYGDEEAREVTGYSLIPEFFEAIAGRDPRFVKAYLNLSPANSLYAAQPKKTVQFMNQVLKAISPETSPLAYYVWIYKGVDEILFLGDLKAARHSYEMASKWAAAVGANKMAARTQETAQFLASNPDSREAQISAWVTVLTTVPDKKTQQYAIEKIKNLGGKLTISSNGKLQVKIR